jgi:hypothetical protein
MAHVILLNFLSTITSTITTAANQDHKKKIHAQVHKKYPGKPFSTREENPAKSFAIFFKRKTSHTITKTSTQEGAAILIISDLNI